MYWWNLQVVIISLMAVIFGLGMAGFAAMHYNILLKNQTTLENFTQYTVKKVRTSSGRKRYVREVSSSFLPSFSFFAFFCCELTWPLLLLSGGSKHLRLQVLACKL